MYNAKEYVESKNAQPGTTTDGVIISIEDGQAKKFLPPKAQEKWKNLEGLAIKIVIEAKSSDGVPFRVERLFGYTTTPDGKMVLKQSSNLGKYKKFYNKLPEVGDVVKLAANAEGYYKLML